MKSPTPYKVKFYRQKFGLTQAELAVLMQVTPRTVINWEQGVHAMRPRDFDYMMSKLTEGAT